MIKDCKPTSAPTVELGNLGLHNASGYYVAKDIKLYPVRRMQSTSGSICMFPCCGDEEYHEHIRDNPTDIIEEQYDSPQERLLDYAEGLKEEHADLSDAQMDKDSGFIGRKRDARWQDERRRRGLIQ